MKTSIELFNQLNLTSPRLRWQCQHRDARKAIARDCKAFARAIAPQTKLALASLATLRDEVLADCQPALNAIRETDNFINSGKSLIAFLKDKFAERETVTSAKVEKPSLPVGLKLPANVCLNPCKL